MKIELFNKLLEMVFGIKKVEDSCDILDALCDCINLND